jgi:hypothetical protein
VKIALDVRPAPADAAVFEKHQMCATIRETDIRDLDRLSKYKAETNR